MDKICTVCKKSKPATTDYYCFSSKTKSGLAFRCKACDKEYRQKHVSRTKKYNDDYRKTHREELRVSKGEHYKKKKDHYREWQKIYRSMKKDYIAEWQRNYANRNRKKKADYIKEYVANHREEVRRIKRRWAINHPIDRLLCSQKRLAIKKQLPATLNKEQWQGILLFFNNRCAYCGTKGDLEQDHFIPLSKGGEYTHNNVVPACRSCNPSKSNKAFFEWYPVQPFYSKKREKKILSFLNYRDGRQQLAFMI